MNFKGIIYIVATPIGNLSDMTFRALEILKKVDLILAEDTRKTKILLEKYHLKKPLISYHQHSRIEKIDNIILQLKSGKNIALVSEAGTPGINDPGNQLVEQIAKEKDIQIIPIPGPCAAITALSISGFPSDKFLFLGFLPKKKGRKTLMSNLPKATIVFYESPYRIAKTLKELYEIIGDKEIVICREMTKKFEDIYRGTISEMMPKIKPKGEFTIVLKNQ